MRMILLKLSVSIKKENYCFSKIIISGRETYTFVDDIPEFPGGLQAFAEFVSNNVKYPLIAREKGIQGRVIATFIVEQDGTLSNLKIAKGIGGGCDEETIRVLKQSPLWKPGSVNGIRVPVAFTVPVAFALSTK